jgi:hypothetical protein
LVYQRLTPLVINVHNPTDKPIGVRKKVAIALPEEQAGPVSPFFEAKLGPDQAMEIDCPDIIERTHTATDFLKGFVVIESPVELDVVTVYTAAGSTGQIETFHTERVLPLQRQVQPSRLPDLVPVKPLGTPGTVGFCKLDSQGRLLVSVRNQGSADAAASTTRVEFFPGGPRLLPTQPLVPGRFVDLPPIDMPKACRSIYQRL